MFYSVMLQQKHNSKKMIKTSEIWATPLVNAVATPLHYRLQRMLQSNSVLVTKVMIPGLCITVVCHNKSKILSLIPSKGANPRLLVLTCNRFFN
jgi:hypothetical protein